MIYLYKSNTGMGRLARKLGISVQINSTREPRKILRLLDTSIDVNWGCAWRSIPYKRAFLNYDISRATDKVLAFRWLSAEGLPVPEWSVEGYADLIKNLSPKKKVLGRINKRKSGAGITLLKADDGQKYDFWVEKLSCKREVRVHVWRDKVIAVQVKLISPESTTFVHSYDNGNCSFSSKLEGRLSSEHFIEAKKLAVRAISALGLDFGAVDLILTHKDQLYVLEVNTAPGIRSDFVEQAYAKVLEQILIKRSARK